MNQPTRALNCQNTECTVAADRRCVRGFPTAEQCPDFVSESDDLGIYGDDEGDEGNITNDSDEYASLPDSEALNSETLYKFLCRKEAAFITILGDQDSGKSTILCALYDRFLRGSFAGLSFAGSKTLVAFEKKAHHSRLVSGLTEPTTTRTSITEGLLHYHLSLKKDQDEGLIDIMFSDRAGESYQKMRDDSSSMDELQELKNPNKLAILLDGAKIIDPFERANALQSVRQSLRVLLDNGFIGPSSDIQIITTKYDLIQLAKNSEELRQLLTAFWTKLESFFAGRVGRLSRWEVSARDPTGTLPIAFGLDAVITDWTSTRFNAQIRKPILKASASQLDKLLIRTRMGGAA